MCLVTLTLTVESLPVAQFPHLPNEGIELTVSKSFVVVVKQFFFF